MRTRYGWLLAALLAMAVGFTPGISEAKGFGRGRGGSSKGSSSSGGGFGRGTTSSAPSVSSGGRRTYYFSGNAPGGGARYGSSYAVGVGVPVYGGYYRPPYETYYGGWGIYPWGYYAYGYYPIWGAPERPAPPPGVPAEAPTPKTSAFSFYVGGAAPAQGFAPNATLHFEGRRWGFNLGAMALVSEGETSADSFYMPYFSGHLTYSLISGPHGRLRLEAGGTSVSASSRTYIGPDFGTSGQIAIAGPLALQGSFHYTPWPARIVDAEAGAGLNFGGLGLKVGWRTIRLDDTSYDPNGGVDLFNGPMVAIGAIY